MISDKDPVATVASRDIKRAREFYEKVLGLELVHSQQDQAFTYKAGHTTLLVYQSQFAGSNQATAVTWPAGNDVDVIVRDLKSKGVTFEHYNLPGLHLEGDVHVMGNFRAAWFKDPDGNIHSLVSG